MSPDGYINSLSVEFSNIIEHKSDDEIKQQAAKALALQADIVDGFLKGNGNGRPNTETTEKANENANGKGTSQQPPNGKNDKSDGAMPAQLLNVGGMNTRCGWQSFITVHVNGRMTKLFGTKRELGDHITAAGFASVADHISQGMTLNLPCRVITKPSPDGKYLNIERVLPARPLQSQGRTGQ